MTPRPIDLDLVDKTVELIPDHAWTKVRQALITAIVDDMPASVLETLTGTYDDFDQAEEILYDYYELPEKQKELILDGFKIMSPSICLELLNSLDLQEE